MAFLDYRESPWYEDTDDNYFILDKDRKLIKECYYAYFSRFLEQNVYIVEGYTIVFAESISGGVRSLLVLRNSNQVTDKNEWGPIDHAGRSAT